MVSSSYFTNIDSVNIAITVLVFIISYMALSKFFRKTAPALVASIAISALVSWRIYKNGIFWEGGLYTIIAIVAILLVIKIFWSFVRRR